MLLYYNLLPMNNNSKNKPKSFRNKFKRVFIVPEDSDQSGEISNTLQGEKQEELQQLQQEYDQLNNLMDQAIQWKEKDFTFTRDVARLQQLEDNMHEIDDRHHNDLSFLQTILKKIVALFPVLIMLLPEDSATRKQLQSFMDTISLWLETWFDPSTLKDQLDLSNDKQKTQFLTIIKLIDQYKQQNQKTQQLTTDTIKWYQDIIADMLTQIQPSKSIQGEDTLTPEQYEAKVKQLILDYDWRATGQSQTPTTDRFQAELLIEKTREYRAWYENNTNKRSELIQQALPVIQDIIDTYTDLVKNETTHAIDKITNQRNKFQDNINDRYTIQELTTIYHNITNQSNQYYETIQSTIEEYNNFLETIKKDDTRSLLNIDQLDADQISKSHTSSDLTISQLIAGYQTQTKDKVTGISIDSISSSRTTLQNKLSSDKLTIQQIKEVYDKWISDIKTQTKQYNQQVNELYNSVWFIDIDIPQDDKQTASNSIKELNQDQLTQLNSIVRDKITNLIDTYISTSDTKKTLEQERAKRQRYKDKLIELKSMGDSLGISWLTGQQEEILSSPTTIKQNDIVSLYQDCIIKNGLDIDISYLKKDKYITDQQLSSLSSDIKNKIVTTILESSIPFHINIIDTSTYQDVWNPVSINNQPYFRAKISYKQQAIIWPDWKQIWDTYQEVWNPVSINNQPYFQAQISDNQYTIIWPDWNQVWGIYQYVWNPVSINNQPHFRAKISNNQRAIIWPDWGQIWDSFDQIYHIYDIDGEIWYIARKWSKIVYTEYGLP